MTVYEQDAKAPSLDFEGEKPEASLYPSVRGASQFGTVLCRSDWHALSGGLWLSFSPPGFRLGRRGCEPRVHASRHRTLPTPARLNGLRPCGPVAPEPPMIGFSPTS